jgi:hypothetical protein
MCMIAFRCWYCNKNYLVAEARIGEHVQCHCKHELRIPKKNHGHCRVKKPIDWVVEIVVYAGGGAFIGCILGIVIVAQMPFLREKFYIIGGLTIFGFLIGLFGGERGINWFGRLIRSREE